MAQIEACKFTQVSCILQAAIHPQPQLCRLSLWMHNAYLEVPITQYQTWSNKKSPKKH